MKIRSFLLLLALLIPSFARAERILYSNEFSDGASLEDFQFGRGRWRLEDGHLRASFRNATSDFAMAVKMSPRLPASYFVQTRIKLRTDPREWFYGESMPYLIYRFEDAQNYKFVRINPPEYLWRHARIDGTHRTCTTGEVVRGHWRALAAFPCVSPIPNQVYECRYSWRCDSHDIQHRVRGWAADTRPKHLSVKIEGYNAYFFIEGVYKYAVRYTTPQTESGVGFLVHGRNTLTGADFDYLNIVE